MIKKYHRQWLVRNEIVSSLRYRDSNGNFNVFGPVKWNVVLVKCETGRVPSPIRYGASQKSVIKGKNSNNVSQLARERSCSRISTASIWRAFSQLPLNCARNFGEVSIRGQLCNKHHSHYAYTFIRCDAPYKRNKRAICPKSLPAFSQATTVPHPKFRCCFYEVPMI